MGDGCSHVSLVLTSFLLRHWHWLLPIGDSSHRLWMPVMAIARLSQMPADMSVTLLCCSRRPGRTPLATGMPRAHSSAPGGKGALSVTFFAEHALLHTYAFGSAQGFIDSMTVGLHVSRKMCLQAVLTTFMFSSLVCAWAWISTVMGSYIYRL